MPEKKWTTCVLLHNSAEFANIAKNPNIWWTYKFVCSGKARRGDGNDLTANPKKLAAIGEKTIFNFRENIHTSRKGNITPVPSRKRAWQVGQRYQRLDPSQWGALSHQVTLLLLGLRKLQRQMLENLIGKTYLSCRIFSANIMTV